MSSASQRPEGRVCIVLPTYNERENLKILLPQIFQEQRRMAGRELHVLVVDDNSPDGTAAAVMEMAAEHPGLHLLTGEKRGLGEAYKRGMAHAMAHLAPDLIFEMDADLQHSPRLIPLFVNLAENGFSLVIGSRFVLGGSTPDFSFKRRMLSRVGNWMLRFLGGMPPIRDCTSGFRCIKAELLGKCDLSQLSTRGYSFQSSLLFELIRNGARVIEVPITFADRQIGESKLSMEDQVEFLLNVFRIRFRKSEEFIKFLLVGASGVAVNLGFYVLFSRGVGLPLEVASLIAIEISIISNFLLNNSFTFGKRVSASGLKKRFLRFHLVAGAAGVVNFTILLLLAKTFGLWDIAANLAGIACATLVNYFLNSRWTWKELEETGTFAIDRESH